MNAHTRDFGMGEQPQIEERPRGMRLLAMGETIPFVKAETEGSLPQRLERVVRAMPDAIAVHSKSHQWTYAGLDRRANRIAQALLARLGAVQEPVALLLDNDAPMIAAMLGVLKAGKMYVPLDPALPTLRATRILKDSAAPLLLTNNAHLNLAQQLGGERVLNVDDVAGNLADDPPRRAIAPDTPAWLLYTSGSTGQPKGVVQTHRNVLHYVWNYARGFGITPADRYALLYSCAVNAGAHVILSTLLNGARLCLYDLRNEGLAPLGDWLVAQEITLYSSVPTLFRQFARQLSDGTSFPKLRLIMMMGEPVYSRDVDLFRQHFADDCVLVNRLGSSETGSILWYFVTKRTHIEGMHVPVGHEVEDNEVVLLGDDGKAVPPGEIGEIAARSRYLSPGYWQRPDLTRAVFLPDPEGGDRRIYRSGDLGQMLPDGRLLCLGRKDFQIKIRGYRVEAAEVEMALMQHRGVQEAVVVGQEEPPGAARLVAYWVAAGEEQVTVSELRRWLLQTLPDYMVPTAFVCLAALPLAPNGKVDRRALPPPGSERPDLDAAFVAPRTPIEKAIAGIWAEVLGLDAVGIHDTFLDLGGTSLLAMRVIARVVQAYEVQVRVRQFFQAATVAEMAQLIAEHVAGAGAVPTE